MSYLTDCENFSFHMLSHEFLRTLIFFAVLRLKETKQNCIRNVLTLDLFTLFKNTVE